MDWSHSEESAEQDSEIEALMGIFLVCRVNARSIMCLLIKWCFIIIQDDFVELTPSTDGPRQFKLHLVPSLKEGEEVFISLDLIIRYTKTYPKTLPKFELTNIKGIDEDDFPELKKRIVDCVWYQYQLIIHLNYILISCID